LCGKKGGVQWVVVMVGEKGKREREREHGWWGWGR